MNMKTPREKSIAPVDLQLVDGGCHQHHHCCPTMVNPTISSTLATPGSFTQAQVQYGGCFAPAAWSMHSTQY
jgi:hypothetical protein